jgi:hypothetical protein
LVSSGKISLDEYARKEPCDGYSPGRRSRPSDCRGQQTRRTRVADGSDAIAATGSDAASAAINETMPALKRTATSTSTAADIYTKADQSLGESLKQYAFSA